MQYSWHQDHFIGDKLIISHLMFTFHLSLFPS